MSGELKAAVTVSEMARMVGLSRARFYQLIGSAFPHPVYDVRTRRPVYVEELQQVCLDVRRRNCGIDGKPVLFYAKGHSVSGQSKPTRKISKPKPKNSYPEVTAVVQALGLTAVTGDQVAQAVRALYPNGLVGANQPEVIRSVFLHLQRRDSAVNHGSKR